MRHFLVPAINGKRLVKLQYDDHQCVVEPHVYGLDRNGDPVLLCYEVSAGGNRRAAGWRQLKLHDAVAVTETSQCFSGARLGYKRNATGFHAIFAQI